MNTNNNVYTIVYTTVIVVIAAAILALAAMALKPRQQANIKAETISQMLTAAGFSSKEDLAKFGNEQILALYSDNIKTAFLIDKDGNKTDELETEVSSIELQDNLKLENKNIAAGNPALPVYVFEKDGAEINVIPCYGAGLWGPVWGYIAFNADCTEIVGAYFDHEGETPGLGAKIKDEAWFREQFKGKTVDFEHPENPFGIIKGGAPADDRSKVDAITGATMTCNGLDAALDTWLAAYIPFLQKKAAAAVEEDCCCCDGDECADCDHDHDHDHGHDHNHSHDHNHQHNHQEG
ncbi:MAG: NADH:ubiquinone reductase (Na(+)-transporting) subunit C [Bacteroidales bacterium]|nr:NADH:ubiquinone reductase (Na(+)-transporting) subunit C [Bacteroidales bacterium]MBQ5435382.1 NADH:ubiquinone reductase (Na(+)-transporting) subunit C [Bacteroidales bacterium]MBQ5529991.1 NADH:ubiquinone reductase (Na(+)-transporting) subunit C [Bacteroidales bacterium]